VLQEERERMKREAPGAGSAGIEHFYNPRSIAIIGASPHRMKPGGRPLVALRERGYAGSVFPVNPSYDEIEGARCYASVLDIPDPVDMAIVSVPAASVLETLRQCAAKGVKAAVLFSAGFGEMGGEGELLQQQLTDLARESGMRLLGPNCLGLMNLTNSVLASFAYIVDLEPVKPATLAFVTQSGAFGAMIYGEATAAGVGFSSFTSVGNEADCEFSDFADYLLDDPHTQVLGGYMEGAKDGQKLRRVAEKALRLEKPMLILKVGRSRSGARAAASHTGSLAGDDQVYDAFFRQMGIIRIDTLPELTAFSVVHRSGRRPRGRRVAILGGSGGHGVLLTDQCESFGLTVPEITGETREQLEKILPVFGSARNPIDLTAQAGRSPGMPMRCLRALVGDDNIDVVLMQTWFHDEDGLRMAQELIEIYQSTEKCMVLLTSNRDASDVTRQCIDALTKAGIPVLPDGRQAARAVAHLAWYQEKLERNRGTAAKPTALSVPRRAEAEALLDRAQPLTEFDCKQVLAAYGIPVSREALATSPDTAVKLAREIGYPVALKVQSAQILHKTEARAIALNLQTDAEVREAYEEILANAKGFAPDARIEGILVQEMVEEGVEVILGTTRDPVFGPVVMFGLGGIFVEVLRDVSFRIAPMTRADAEEMIEEIRGTRVLEGVRGRPPIDREALIDAILRVSQLVTDHADTIEEVDLNPLVLLPRGAKAVDALIQRSQDEKS
jgi:acetyltransferase